MMNTGRHYFLIFLLLSSLLIKETIVVGQGTYPVFENVYNHGVSHSVNLLGSLDRLIYSDQISSNRKMLYSSDGTANGTIRMMPDYQQEVTLIHKGLAVWYFTEKRNDIFYISTLTPGVDTLTSIHTNQLSYHHLTYWNDQFVWVENAPDSSHSKLQFFDPAADSVVTLLEMGFNDFRTIGISDSLIFFIASDNAHEKWLGTSEGTVATTKLVKQLFGAGDNLDKTTKFFSNKNDVYFFYNSQDTSTFLWGTDGTGAGTLQLGEYKKIHSWSSYEAIFYHDKFYFNLLTTDSEPESPTNFHVSNGTIDGTFPLKTIGIDYSPDHFTIYNDRLYFLDGWDLGSTDGTTEGTDIHFGYSNPEDGFNSVHDIGIYDGQLVLNINTDSVGYELFKSDGTINGTTLLSDILRGEYYSGNPRQMTQVGELLFFVVPFDWALRLFVYDPDFQFSCDSFEMTISNLLHVTDSELGSFRINAIGGQMPYYFSLNNSIPDNVSGFNDLVPGVYSVIAIDNLGCTQETTIEILQSTNGQEIEPYEYQIHPNPVAVGTDIQVQLQLPSHAGKELIFTMYYSTGQVGLKMKMDVQPENVQYELPTTGLVPGFYVLGVDVNGIILLRKNIAIH